MMTAEGQKEFVEACFWEALKAGDIEGVGVALRVMAGVDPARAVELYDHLMTSVVIAPFSGFLEWA